MYSPTLLEYPFLYCYNEVNPASTRKICHSAVSFATLSQGDIVFSDCETRDQPIMYFVEQGRLSYVKGMPASGSETLASWVEEQGKDQVVEPGSWACEGVLWTSWMTYGTLTATEDCRLAQLDSEKFRSIVAPFPTSHPYRYATAFVDRLNEMQRQDLSDLWSKDFVKAIAHAFPDKFNNPQAEGSDQPDGAEKDGNVAHSQSLGTGARKFFKKRTLSKNLNWTPAPDKSGQPRLLKKLSRSQTGALGAKKAGLVERSIFGANTLLSGLCGRRKRSSRGAAGWE
jgi:CRP-like cAMP-binding protein